MFGYGESQHYYRCRLCHQRMMSKGWGSHVNGAQCARDTAIYEEGFAAAKSMMFGKLNQVKP